MYVLEMLKKNKKIAEKHSFCFAAHTRTSYIFSFKYVEKGSIIYMYVTLFCTQTYRS